MTTDPDHLQVLAVSLHVVECPPAQTPYERYGIGHRKRHEELARQLPCRLRNAGYTLTANEGAP